MKTSILPFAIAMSLTALTACSSGNTSANDPNSATTPQPQLDTKPVPPGDRMAADTVGVDSLRNRSLEKSMDSTTAAPKR
ncbi:MAG: hypothetical protein ABI373_00085 [Flavobacteriales bacterium]